MKSLKFHNNVLYDTTLSLPNQAKELGELATKTHGLTTRQLEGTSTALNKAPTTPASLRQLYTVHLFLLQADPSQADAAGVR